MEGHRKIILERARFTASEVADELLTPLFDGGRALPIHVERGGERETETSCIYFIYDSIFMQQRSRNNVQVLPTRSQLIACGAARFDQHTI